MNEREKILSSPSSLAAYVVTETDIPGADFRAQLCELRDELETLPERLAGRLAELLERQ